MKKFLPLMMVAVLALVASASAEVPLRPGDTFEVRLGGVPVSESTSVNGAYTIDGDGYLNLPLIGRLAVSNMNASQVQAAAERAYVNQGYYTHPTVTINVAPAARFVNVGGQVKAPQRVSYTPDMTVLSAITSAGDFNEYADQKHVRLIRGGKVTVVNCKAIRADPSQDLKVNPGDQIQVPQSILF